MHAAGDLKSLFQEVDDDGSGEIDAAEFQEFLESDPLACEMTLDVFSGSMWQLLMLWVKEGSTIEQYASFLQQLFNRITTKIVNADGTVTTTGMREMIMTRPGMQLQLSVQCLPAFAPARYINNDLFSCAD